MLRKLRDFIALNKASRALGRASSLNKRGQDADAAQAYADVIRRLDAIGVLPTDSTRLTIRDIGHASIRIVACAEWAILLDKAGDHDRARELARQVLNICTMMRQDAKDPKARSDWEGWARAFLTAMPPPS